MRKTILGAAALVAVLAMGSCESQKENGSESKQDRKEMFTGVVAAADAPGIRYDLKLDYDSTDNGGSYELKQIYLESDSTATDGVKDGKEFESKGDFSVLDKEGKSYLKLVQDATSCQKDSACSAACTPVCFLVDSDSTLTLVNADLQVSENPSLNYTLKLKK